MINGQINTRFPFDGIPRPDLLVPGMRCKFCGRGAIYWLSGKGAWNLKAPLPHYQCLACGVLFHDDYPRNSKEYFKKYYPKIENLYKNG